MVWTQETATGDALHARTLAANGAPTSANETLLSWDSVTDTPAIISHAGERLIAFSGEQDTSVSDPYSHKYGYYLTSSNGTAWTLAHATLGSNPENGYADATDAGGTPVVAYTDAYSNGYRAGFDSLPPTTSDHSTNPLDGGCCTYYGGVGYDTRSTQTWITWFSSTDKAAVQGVDAQRIYPSLGRLVHAPSSSTKYAGEVSSVDPGQRVQVAARHGGGLYTVYGVGYPTQTEIALWKLGARKPLLLKTHDDIADVGVTAAQGGRLWVYWYDRHTETLRAVRTDTAATRFGAIRTVHPPSHARTVWKTAGDGGNGGLDLVINASARLTSTEHIFSTQVLPGLSGRVSPGKASRGSRITVTVTDAGTPVRGAAVHYDGTTKRTDSHGRVVFHVAKGTTKGRHTVTFGDSGYAGGSLHFRVA